MPATTPSPTAPLWQREEKPRATDIVLAWLQSKTKGRPKTTIYSHEVELELPQFAMRRFQKKHSPSTFARRWREVKADDLLERIGVTRCEPFDDPERSERGWHLYRDDCDDSEQVGQEILGDEMPYPNM